MNWLEAQPGGSWQDRWLASGAENAADWRDLVVGLEGGPRRDAGRHGQGPRLMPVPGCWC